jgi:hypothetical protein
VSDPEPMGPYTASMLASVAISSMLPL